MNPELWNHAFMKPQKHGFVELQNHVFIIIEPWIRGITQQKKMFPCVAVNRENDTCFGNGRVVMGSADYLYYEGFI